MKKKNYTVCELFAGVGGFRLGLEESNWQVIWSNQWEPFKKEQFASDCYVAHFGKDGHSNEDITVAKHKIPRHTLLVGGFPCQDYSVATTMAKGIHGKKGVLWWEIRDIIKHTKPPYILLENVDRILRSPSKQRGRDFGIILSCLNELGYTVEWRMINAANYGFPQKRRRTFIFATKDKQLINDLYSKKSYEEVIESTGFFAQEFPVEIDRSVRSQAECVNISSDLIDITNSFQHHFFNSGFMRKGVVYTIKTLPIAEGINSLGNIILECPVDKKYYISKNEISKWKYFKGAKNEPRTSKTGFIYKYSEGAIPFPDKLDSPSRTMLTSEGGTRPNRITHVIKDPKNGRLRRLIPEETERLNGFPAGWTNTGMPERWRYFCMGNALVVGLIARMGKRLRKVLNNSKQIKRLNQILPQNRKNIFNKECDRAVNI
jgi:DNA (cytosine-5)-methyltransferase 1